MDRLISQERRSAQVMLRSAELLKGPVLKLHFTAPVGFTFQAGQYVQLCCDQVNPEEWHPFTLTSAPEEQFLSVHCRCPDELDWCSEFRRAAFERPLGEDKMEDMVGKKVVYVPCGAGKLVYATPKNLATGAKSQAVPDEAIVVRNDEENEVENLVKTAKGKSTLSVKSLTELKRIALS